MNIEEVVLDSLHEIIPNASFSKHSTIKFVNFTIKQFKNFQKEIQTRLNVDITEFDFHKWKTVNDIIRDVNNGK
jgi:hypothetical protein